jgi:IclR family transcriptional regulator, acetate operon repressor
VSGLTEEKKEGHRQVTVTKKEKDTSEYKALVPALDQAINILLYLQNAAGMKMSLTNICKAVGMHKSKGHSILKTLHRYDIVTRDPDSKAYTLGARLIPLARAVLDHLDFRSAAAPIVRDLARETGMTVWFGLAMNESLFVVSKYEGGEHFWATPGIGQTFHLYEGAHGKAAVAFLPEKEREAILSRVKNRKDFLRELDFVGRSGFARDAGEFAKGINAVAAPVFGPGQQVMGVLLLFGTSPKAKLDGLGRKTADAARRISQKLGN